MHYQIGILIPAMIFGISEFFARFSSEELRFSSWPFIWMFPELIIGISQVERISKKFR